MFPEKFGLDKWDDQPKRTFDFIQHEESVYVLQRCLEIWRKRMRAEEVINELHRFIDVVGQFE